MDRLSLTWDAPEGAPGQVAVGVEVLARCLPHPGQDNREGLRRLSLVRTTSWTLKGYADSGHGGNKKLKELTPSNFVFTILQRTSPDLVPAEIVQIEESWKA